MDYNMVKWLHILSATVLFGTGLGSAYYMFFVSLTADAKAAAVVVRYVVRADWFFTAPTAVFQPLSGYWLMRLANYPADLGWIAASFALYGFAIACWLPVVWMQIRMRDLAQQAADRDESLPRRYWLFLELWTLLGTLAFFSLVAVLWLMVNKPA